MRRILRQNVPNCRDLVVLYRLNRREQSLPLLLELCQLLAREVSPEVTTAEGTPEEDLNE